MAPLAGVHVTSPDLLPVLAAGQLRRLEPLLHRHESLLNAAAALLGAVRPARPRPHPAPCGGRTGDSQTPVETRNSDRVRVVFFFLHADLDVLR